MTKEEMKLLKALGVSMKVNLTTSNGESDLAFTLKSKGIRNHEAVAKKVTAYVRKNYAGVIDYDQIPEVLSEVM